MERYSHRNGETEPPTEEGYFWLEGNSGRIEFGKGWGTSQPHYVFPRANCIHLDRDNTIRLSSFTGRFWGPVTMPVTPWENE